MSTHGIAAPVVTLVMLLCLTACGGDSSSEATDEPTPEASPEVIMPDATDAPERETFTVSGTYAEQGGGSSSEKCVSGEDLIVVKASLSRKVVGTGKTSADGKFDKQAKACLYKFLLRKVAENGTVYAIVVGASEPRDFVRSDAEGLFITD